jgi:hypothetical protein
VGTDTGAAADVTQLARGFLLDTDNLPGPGLLNWTGDVELTVGGGLEPLTARPCGSGRAPLAPARPAKPRSRRKGQIPDTAH